MKKGSKDILFSALTAIVILELLGEDFSTRLAAIADAIGSNLAIGLAEDVTSPSASNALTETNAEQ